MPCSNAYLDNSRCNYLTKIIHKKYYEFQVKNIIQKGKKTPFDSSTRRERRGWHCASNSECQRQAETEVSNRTELLPNLVPSLIPTLSIPKLITPKLECFPRGVPSTSSLRRLRIEQISCNFNFFGGGSLFGRLYN